MLRPRYNHHRPFVDRMIIRLVCVDPIFLPNALKGAMCVGVGILCFGASGIMGRVLSSSLAPYVVQGFTVLAGITCCGGVYFAKRWGSRCIRALLHDKQKMRGVSLSQV